ncbi:MAG: hypothetical protein NTV56_21520, partial [Alphaproteobacteria bacterium]|nr:hypothetical protein [Alphaproteobacteria bacterium]
MHIERPVAAFAELAVADDIDAGLDLLPRDLIDGGFQAGFVGGLVIGLAGLDESQELLAHNENVPFVQSENVPFSSLIRRGIDGQGITDDERVGARTGGRRA